MSGARFLHGGFRRRSCRGRSAAGRRAVFEGRRGARGHHPPHLRKSSTRRFRFRTPGTGCPYGRDHLHGCAGGSDLSSRGCARRISSEVWQGIGRRAGNSGAYSGKYLHGDHGRGEIIGAMGSSDRGHFVHRRCGPPRLVAPPHAGATCGPALRQPTRQIADAPGQRSCLSGAWCRLSLRKEYASRAIVDDRNRAAHQLCAADQEQGRVRHAVDQQPSRAAGILPEGRRD